ncbi:MAG: chemotaxis protein CheW [Gammaproteobacteria bacterium]|nr:chemotaxis protein CheW [Gammaproteobacteria bacterium]
MVTNELIGGVESEIGAQESVRQILTFHLAGEIFGFDILRVKEILEFGQITAVPLMPAFVKGVINLRGAVVPVIDLLARFDRPSSNLSRRTCIVILETDYDGGKQDLGVVVDAVNEVRELANRDIESAPKFGAAIRADFIECMAKVKENFTIVLAVDKVLSLEEMADLARHTSGNSSASKYRH